jgi:O-antigen/teichoic acid export membrane protein
VIVAGVFATDFSRLLFGPSWDRAAVVAMLLAFAAWRHVTGHTTGAVLLSHGRPDLQVRWTAYALVFSIIYFVIGMPWGLEGVAGAQAIFEVGGWMVRHTMANRILNLSWRQFARSLSPLWIAQGIYVVVVIALRQTSLMLLPATAIRLPVGLLLSTVAYFVIVRIALPGLLTTLGKGVLQSFAHGVARTASAPPSPQPSDVTVA